MTPVWGTSAPSAERTGADEYLVTRRLEGNFPCGAADLKWRFASSVVAVYGHLGSPASVTSGFKPALTVAAALSLLGAITALAVTAPRGQPALGKEPSAATIAPHRVSEFPGRPGSL